MKNKKRNIIKNRILKILYDEFNVAAVDDNADLLAYQNKLMPRDIIYILITIGNEFNLKYNKSFDYNGKISINKLIDLII